MTLARYFLFFIVIFNFFISANIQANQLEKNRLKHNSLVNNKVERIIALSPHAVEMLFALGAGDKIVATVEHADYPSAALKIPRIGSYSGIQIEQLVALKPDLVIGWKNGNRLTDLNKIMSLGFNVFFTHPQTIEEINLDLMKLGNLIGQHDQARQLTKELKQRYIKIKKKYQSKEKINVFYQLWHKPLRTVGKGSWVESLINDCGATNIFSSAKARYPLVSLETILAKNPQMIIIPGHYKTIKLNQKNENIKYVETQETKNSIKNWSKWGIIDAVKNKHIISLDGDLLHRVGPRAIEGLDELCISIDKVRK